MAITLRNTKGTALTYAELDTNFSELSSSIASARSGSFTGSLTGTVKSAVTSSLTGSISGSTPFTLTYGTNVFSKVDGTRNICMLPSSQVGQTIDVINNGEDVLFISSSGVTINGNSSSFYPILPNGAVHRVANTSNNVWSVAPTFIPLRFAGTYELIVNHTSGSETNMWSGHLGTKGTISSSLVGASVNVPYSTAIRLTPSASYWNTYRPSKAWATNLEVESNVLASDLVNGGMANDKISAFIQHVYLRATNSLILNTSAEIALGDPELIGNQAYGSGNYIYTSSVQTPYGGNIGDKDTVYGNSDTQYVGGYTLGTGIGQPLSGSVSQHWYTFGVTIPATAATKTYKFLFALNAVR